MKFLRRLLFALTLLCPLTHASEEIFEYLALLPPTQTNTIGKVCERITEHAFIDAFSDDPSITVLSNISYTDLSQKKKRNHRVLGEVDVLILRNGYLWQFIEVKCSNKNNVKKARKKALQQIERFNDRCVKDTCAMWNGKQRIDVKIPANKAGIEFYVVSYKDSHDDFVQFEASYAEVSEMHAKLQALHALPRPRLIRQNGYIKTINHKRDK